jgi:purine nucleoside permease
MRAKPRFPATLSPADFPIGSAESRAAARNAVDRRQQERIAAVERTNEWRGAYGLAALGAKHAGKAPSEHELRERALELYDHGITTVLALVRALSDERRKRTEVESRTEGDVDGPSRLPKRAE